MVDDDLQDLMKARTALTNERRTRARGIATSSGTISNELMENVIKVQEAIDVIDRAIEELEEAEEVDEDE